jgi:hypothetical protein
VTDFVSLVFYPFLNFFPSFASMLPLLLSLFPLSPISLLLSSSHPQGYYTKKVINRADGFVVQAGDADPAGTVHGYVPPGASEERKIPLEISLKVSDPYCTVHRL